MSVFTKGARALITGGSSGIGYAVAQHCLRLGMKTAIVDINPTTLQYAKENLAADGEVETYHADVGQAADWAMLKEAVEVKFGGAIDFLMLNAGVGTKGTWGDSEYFHKIFNTNLFGVINGLNAFVPAFQTRTAPGTIVITGSKQGITNPPGNAAYNASKSAVKALAEHLSFDLRGSQTSVHLLVPGWTFTGLSGNQPGSTAQKPNGAWHASQVADFMFQKIEARAFYIICPDDDVTEETDKRRMLWTVGDVVNGRPPLTRWRPEFKDEAARWMEGVDLEKA